MHTKWERPMSTSTGLNTVHIKEMPPPAEVSHHLLGPSALKEHRIKRGVTGQRVFQISSINQDLVSNTITP